MALEKAMGSMVLEKIICKYQEDKQVLEKTIFILARAKSSFSFAGLGKDQEAKFSFAGFGKDHHAMCKKSDYAATKILICS